MALIEDDFEVSIKIIVVGNGRVGKSSMIRRFCKGTYTDTYKQTIGVDFLEKDHYVEAIGENVKLMVWDTAGQEEFDAITRTYYRGAGACVLAFSTVDRESFEAVESWKAKVEAECERVPMVLVQNKIDLIDDTVVTNEEAEDLARRLGCRFYRTSVKENYKIQEVFEYLALQYFKFKKQRDLQASQNAAAVPVSFNEESTKKPKAKPKEEPKEAKKQADYDSPTPRDSTTDTAPIRLDAPSKQRTAGKKTFMQKAAKCVI